MVDCLLAMVDALCHPREAAVDKKQSIDVVALRSNQCFLFNDTTDVELTLALEAMHPVGGAVGLEQRFPSEFVQRFFSQMTEQRTFPQPADQAAFPVELINALTERGRPCPDVPY